MMRFSTLIKNPADWMIGCDFENSVVLTSRIRLARNLKNLAFPDWASKEERCNSMDVILPVIENLPAMKDAFSQTLQSLSPIQKQVLVERHLISRDHAARNEGSAAVIERRQSLSIMINEEDHLRLQAIRPGLNLRAAYQALSEVDDRIQQQLPIAFHHKLGYITNCPTNLGTGMRASAMVHLPGLVLSEQITPVLKGIARLGLAVRGLFGEGTDSLGNLYQISNQSTLGEKEETIIERLERVVNDVISYEKNARQKLLEESILTLKDKIGRAYGILTHAWMIDSREALTHISILRLGAQLGFFPSLLSRICDALLMDIQPGHLQLKSKSDMNPEDRDTIRAEIIRSHLQNFPPPANFPVTNIDQSFPEPPTSSLS